MCVGDGAIRFSALGCVGCLAYDVVAASSAACRGVAVRCFSACACACSFLSSFSRRFPAAFPPLSRHFLAAFPSLSRRFPTAFPPLSRHFPTAFPALSRHSQGSFPARSAALLSRATSLTAHSARTLTRHTRAHRDARGTPARRPDAPGGRALDAHSTRMDSAKEPPTPWWRGGYQGGDTPMLLWSRLAAGVRPHHLATFYFAVFMSTPSVLPPGG